MVYEARKSEFQRISAGYRGKLGSSKPIQPPLLVTSGAFYFYGSQNDAEKADISIPPSRPGRSRLIATNFQSVSIVQSETGRAPQFATHKHEGTNPGNGVTYSSAGAARKDSASDRGLPIVTDGGLTHYATAFKGRAPGDSRSPIQGRCLNPGGLPLQPGFVIDRVEPTAGTSPGLCPSPELINRSKPV
jgi:hypothetical protein